MPFYIFFFCFLFLLNFLEHVAHLRVRTYSMLRLSFVSQIVRAYVLTHCLHILLSLLSPLLSLCFSRESQKWHFYLIHFYTFCLPIPVLSPFPFIIFNLSTPVFLLEKLSFWRTEKFCFANSNVFDI